MAGLANDVRSCGGKRTRATQGQSDAIDPEPTQRPASNRKTFVTSKSRLDCQDEHRRHFNCWNETVVAAESAKLKAEGLLGLAQLWPPQSRSIERAAPAIGKLAVPRAGRAFGPGRDARGQRPMYQIRNRRGGIERHPAVRGAEALEATPTPR
jgi:hypothetical protein